VILQTRRMKISQGEGGKPPGTSRTLYQNGFAPRWTPSQTVISNPISESGLRDAIAFLDDSDWGGPRGWLDIFTYTETRKGARIYVILVLCKI